MHERSKIIISTERRNGKHAETKPQPTFFDEEATLTARRVVPLSKADKSKHSRLLVSARRRTPLIVLLVVAALGLGVVGGLAIGFYQNRRQIEAQSVNNAQPQSEAVGQTIEPPAAVVAQSPVVPEPESSPVTRPNQQSSTEDKERINDPGTEDADDNVDEEKRDQSTPTTTRKQRRSTQQDEDERMTDEEREQQRSERERRRERRRRSTDEAADQDVETARQIRRVRDELHRRIRDIFEGREP